MEGWRAGFWLLGLTRVLGGLQNGVKYRRRVVWTHMGCLRG
jgi:hypothetical protein